MNWTGINRPKNWQQFSARFAAAAVVFLLYFNFLGGQGVLIDTVGVLAVMFISIWLIDRLFKRSE